MNAYRKRKGSPYVWDYRKRKEWGRKIAIGKRRSAIATELEAYILDTYGVDTDTPKKAPKLFSFWK